MKRRGNPGHSEDTGTEAGTHLLQKAEVGSECRLPCGAHLLLFPRKQFPEKIASPETSCTHR